MIQNENTYQSILYHLSLIPTDYLKQIESYLQNFTELLKEKKETNRQAILALAGSWNDMSEDDFQDILAESKKVGKELFNDNIEL